MVTRIPLRVECYRTNDRSQTRSGPHCRSAPFPPFVEFSPNLSLSLSRALPRDHPQTEWIERAIDLSRRAREERPCQQSNRVYSNAQFQYRKPHWNWHSPVGATIRYNGTALLVIAPPTRRIIDEWPAPFRHSASASFLISFWIFFWFETMNIPLSSRIFQRIEMSFLEESFFEVEKNNWKNIISYIKKFRRNIDVALEV